MSKNVHPFHTLPDSVKSSAIKCADLGDYFQSSEDYCWRFPDIIRVIESLVASGYLVFSVEVTSIRHGRAVDFDGECSYDLNPEQLAPNHIQADIVLKSAKKIRDYIEKYFDDENHVFQLTYTHVDANDNLSRFLH